MKKILLVCSLLSFGSAQAATFQGSSSGEFINPAGPSGVVVTGVGTNDFTWGVGSPPSSLGYLGASFDVDENDSFVLGTLNYFNGTITGGTGATSVDLSVLLDFTIPSGVSDSFVYNLGLINSPNSSDPKSSADIVNFDNTVPSNFFSFDGTEFTVEFLGFGQLIGGGFTIDDSFRVLEGESATVDLVGRITSTPGVDTGTVPEPASFALLGLGLAGIRLSRMKKRA